MGKPQQSTGSRVHRVGLACSKIFPGTCLSGIYVALKGAAFPY